MDEYKLQAEAERVAKYLIDNQEELDPEISKLVSENLWDLI